MCFGRNLFNVRLVGCAFYRHIITAHRAFRVVKVHMHSLLLYATQVRLAMIDPKNERKRVQYEM